MSQVSSRSIFNLYKSRIIFKTTSPENDVLVFYVIYGIKMCLVRVCVGGGIGPEAQYVSAPGDFSRLAYPPPPPRGPLSPRTGDKINL
jgi:hypothetical protein